MDDPVDTVVPKESVQPAHSWLSDQHDIGIDIVDVRLDDHVRCPPPHLGDATDVSFGGTLLHLLKNPPSGQFPTIDLAIGWERREPVSGIDGMDRDNVEDVKGCMFFRSELDGVVDDRG